MIEPEEPSEFLLTFLGAVISERRQEIKLTREELCDLTGFSHSYAIDIERTTVNIGFSNLIKLAQALNWNTYELLRAMEDRAKNIASQTDFSEP